LYLPIVDPSKLPNGLSKTPGLNLVYAGKYRAFVGQPDIPHNLKYVEIFRDGKKRQPRSEVLELLGKAECLYLWENSSIAVEAMLLDTPCMFIKNPFLGELIAEKELGTAGSGYGFSSESFENAKNTLPEFQRLYSSARVNFWNQLEFILSKNETHWSKTENSTIKLPNYFSSNVKHKIFLFFGVIKAQGFLTALKVLKKFTSRS
jgi:hypothetical protein